MGLLGGSESIVDPAARDKYLLQVTAGPSYDPNTHAQVSVNSAEVHKVDNSLATTYLRVRIKNYHGLPRDAPENCSYFNHPLHTSDRYSVAWSFVPKRDMAGTDLIMGFDFSHSVRDRLPPGTKTAVKIATTVLDPGLYADPYSDEPYLYGPALSSMFAFRVGGMVEEEGAEAQLKRLESENDGVVEEGGSLSGESVRDSQNIPGSWKARRKFFLDPAQLEKFTFEKGRMYHADFFNPHLDFSNFSLRLPGFSISVAKYVDEKTHHLRFVLKSRESGEVVFVVFFKLLFGQQLEETLRSINATEPPQKPETEDTSPDTRRLSKQREILGGSQAPAFEEPKGFAAPKSFTRDDESDYTLKAAATTLAHSIAAAFSTMGIGNLTETDGENPAPSSRWDAEAPDDETVERQLRDQNSSSRYPR